MKKSGESIKRITLKKDKRGLFETRVYTIEKSLKHHVIEWTATFMSLLGAILNTFKMVEGFYLFMVGNFFWLLFSIKHKHWGLLVTNIIFFILNVVAIVFWSQTP